MFICLNGIKAKNTDDLIKLLLNSLEIVEYILKAENTDSAETRNVKKANSVFVI